MILKKTILNILLLFALSLARLQAQEAITTTSGGNASGSGGTASYTLGQIAFTTQFGSNAIITQGVQQPFEILTSVIGIYTGINLYFSAYPNPTTDFLILKVENYNKNNLSYQLYNINGILLQHEKISSCETAISMKNLLSSVYFLNITEKNKEIQSFKIIKN